MKSLAIWIVIQKSVLGECILKVLLQQSGDFIRGAMPKMIHVKPQKHEQGDIIGENQRQFIAPDSSTFAFADLFLWRLKFLAPGQGILGFIPGWFRGRFRDGPIT